MTPQSATLDDDRGRDRRAPAVAARDLRGLARGVVVPVDPRRPFRLRNERQHVVAADDRTSSHGHPAWRCAPASDRRCRAVAVIPADDRDVRVEQRADLHRNGIEDLAGRSIASDERRDAPQRGLLVGEPCKRASRDSAFAIAVATSSVNAASRVSASSAHGSLRFVPAMSAPQSRPPTRIGAPTVEAQPQVARERDRPSRPHRHVRLAAPAPGRDHSAGDRVGLERQLLPDRHGRPVLAPGGDQSSPSRRPGRSRGP